MIPKINAINLRVETAPATTYSLSTGQQLDGLESLKQAVFLMLSIDRYRHIIYSWNYGIELTDLIGKDMDYVKLELKRRITDVLMVDDRVKSVTDFNFEHALDKLVVSFKINSIYGQLEASKAVNL